MSPKQPVFTLHWLEQSRSHRIAWLLEELNLDYDLKLYHRGKDGSAPEKFKKLFPLGKSPLLEIDYQTGEPSVKIVESGHIVNYLIRKFDKQEILTPKTEQGKDDVDFFLQFSEASIGENITYIAALAYHIPTTSLEDRPAITKFVDKFNNDYNYAQLNLKLKFLESKLSKNSSSPSSKDIYFVEDKLTGADIILMFNIHFIIDSGIVSGVEKNDYPLLTKWLNNLKARPAMSSASDKISRLGDGKYPVGF